MPIEVILPKVDMDMLSGKISFWLKSEGDAVEQGEALFEIETDKATMEVESPGTGTLQFVTAQPGDDVPIGHAVAWIFEQGEEIVAPSLSDDLVSRNKNLVEENDANGANAHLPKEDQPGKNANSLKVRATPLARRIAKESKIDLADIVGSGPKGRVTKADVELELSKVEKSRQSSAVTTDEVKKGEEKVVVDLALGYSTTPVTKMRSVIARRLTESKTTIPHFYLNADVELDALLNLRSQLNLAIEAEGLKKISVNDFLIKACANALKDVPDANVSWDEDKIIRYDQANVSVAVSIDGGLVTPVVRNAEAKSIKAISYEVADLVLRAKSGKLSNREYQGGSFSISNLGMFGVKSFNAIINPPESMILAVGQGTKQFVPDAEGKPVLKTLMSVSLSCDHRVVDGALGAKWLNHFVKNVENPVTMILS